MGDKLIKKYKGHATALVADVDCTAEGKPLCEEHGVEGFPTIKWGDPASLEDYEGGRDFSDLKEFADENLKPLCSPANIDLCDDEKKAKIAELSAMTADQLKTKIDQATEEMASINKNFEAEVEKLQATYEALEKDKTAKLAELKKSGTNLMKAVLATKESKEEL